MGVAAVAIVAAAAGMMAASAARGSAPDPGKPKNMPTVPDVTDDSVQNARMFERRNQLGLMGRMSTYLTTDQKQSSPIGGGGSASTTPASQSAPTSALGG